MNLTPFFFVFKFLKLNSKKKKIKARNRELTGSQLFSSLVLINIVIIFLDWVRNRGN